MLTKETFEKFMQDVQTQIDALDEQTKKNAEDVLQSVYDNYQNVLTDRISYELALAEEALRTGNSAAVEHHKSLANIYKSILENHVSFGPITNNNNGK